MPKVTIIIPCYNLGHFLDEAVDSALAQTFGDFEILIVDDGSTDPATRSLLDDYTRPKTRLLRTEHVGVTRARNLAIAEATGEYLSFLDADDKMHPRFLERTVGVLDGDSGLTFASCWVHLFGAEEWDWKAESCDLVTLLNDCSVATAALVRRSAVVEVGGNDPEMELGHEDWDMWLSIVERGHRGTIIPEVLFYYRRRDDSRSVVSDHGATYLELFRDLMRKHQASYRANLFESLWRKECTIGHQLEAIDYARAETREWDERRLRSRAALEAANRELEQRLEAALGRKHAETDALRRSYSWRVTAPLRRARDWMTRWVRA
jgi:glycosyltransferase involved in cell wall biosynthesis